MKFKKLISSSKKGNIVAALIEKGNLKSKTKKTIKTKKIDYLGLNLLKNY